MKILITYYSKTGNTKKIANDLAKKLDADIDEIIDLTDRSGIKGWLEGGRDATKANLTKIKTTKNPEDYDLVIIGTPVWAWNSTPAIRTYLTEFKKQLNKVAIFVTSGAVPPERPVAFLEKILGKKVLCFAGWNTLSLGNKKIYNEKLEEFVNKIREC